MRRPVGCRRSGLAGQPARALRAGPRVRCLMLQARDLCKTYPAGPRPVEAVAGLSLDVAAGEFLAVCGRSGSGKSTLLGMVGGICRPTRGTVRLNGTDLWSLSANRLADLRNRDIGFVFQFASL